MTLDSRPGTWEHIARVRALLDDVIVNLLRRAEAHDASKLEEPELSAFDVWAPRLAELEYGSRGYRDALARMTPALEHHYALNSHHPEGHEDGIRGMSLLDLLEMLVDWKAASERARRPLPAAEGRAEAPAYDSDLRRSVELNAERFGYGEELRAILLNTCAELGL